MASKFVALCSLFAAANAGLLPGAVTYSAGPAVSVAGPVVRYSPASEVSHVYNSYAAPAALAYGPASVAVGAPTVGATQESVYRSFGGTVSQYSKAEDTPFSSVRKYDTRINNNVYTPAIAKTLTYAAPASAVVAHSAPGLIAHSGPAVYSAHAPTVYSAQGPAVYSAHAPTVYSAQGPAVYSAHAPAVYSAHAPAVYSAQAPTLYSAHATPAVTAYATKALSYSPATAVAHVSFDGYGASYGW